ncbi:MAG: SoxR reducing system RseC family protein [Spirochaetaceae bacterium]|nr:SoxR reducing system RseC family protein [Spirochaetaceae bacterium]
MVDNALIINLTKTEIQVIPLITDACINCEKSGCAKQGKPFSVSNPKNLEIKKGDIVKLKANPTSQTLQGFFSLIVTILGAILGFFLGGQLGIKFEAKNTEIFQAVGVLLGLIITSVLVFICSKTLLKLRKTEIVEVL